MESAVVEMLVQYYPMPVKMVGINDRSGESGNPDVLMKAFGLTSTEIIDAVKEVLKRKTENKCFKVFQENNDFINGGNINEYF